MSSNRHRSNNQAGMVSIIVTLIMMIVMTLIVIGFSQVARRNQREALDRQLASQAYYAAESGVNGVIAALNYSGSDPTNHKYSPSTDSTNYTGCNDFISHFNLTSSLDATSGTAYTCLLVNPNPSTVVTQVGLGTSKVVHLKPSGPTTLKLEWHSADGLPAGASNCPTNGAANTFVPQDKWREKCDYGLLRVDIFTGSIGDDADTMNSKTAALYLVPSTVGTTVTPIPGQAAVAKAACAGGTCTITTSTTYSGDIYLRESAIYSSLGNVTISGGNGITFAGAQLVVDATGKAQDQLKRIQVRIPLTGNSAAPSFALESGDGICKRFTTLGTGHYADDDTTNNGVGSLCDD